MKALIWLGSIAVYAFAQQTLRAHGIILGAAPSMSLFLACTGVARKITRKI